MTHEFNQICVVGLGYIGLPTAAAIAQHQTSVLGLDINEHIVDVINRGQIHIVEPGLADSVAEAVKNGRLRASTAAEPADAFIIAVPTPFKGEDHEPDLTFVESASNMIAPVLKENDLVIIESTSPVGTTEKVANWLAQLRPDLSFPQNAGEDSDIRVAYCPERVLPGQVMRELVENDRIIGGMTEACSQRAIDMYGIFVEADCIPTNCRTAEMAKLTENSFRDVNIAFANELSLICDDLDINVWDLIPLTNLHPRVNILRPGPGVGGHCIAVDPWFIVNKSPDKAKIIRAAREINDDKPVWVVKKIETAVAQWLKNNPDATYRDVVICCYGLAFKPDIDDLRESPALQIAQALDQDGPGELLLVEPHISELPEGFSKGRLVDQKIATQQANIHVLLVGHSEFYQQPQLSDDAVVVDVQGHWS